MMQIVINPGSGPVRNGTEQQAEENIKHFLLDSDVPRMEYVRLPGKDYGEGRFCFLCFRGRRCVEVQMPGIPLHQVRFMDDPTQDIWEFPRLYVDDSSWVWKYALLKARDFADIIDQEDEEEIKRLREENRHLRGELDNLKILIPTGEEDTQP